MANYNSIPRRFNKPTSNINHAYIDATLKSKQSTIDTNFGLLQQTVEQTLGQDLIRESDREYLKGKVSGVLNALDNTDAIKFDSKKARFTIQDALSEAAKDPEVLRQISNTKKIRKVQEFYQKRSEKGNLNQQNFQHAYNKSGANSYINGDSNDVGEFQYLEYVDVNKKLTDTSKTLQAMKPDMDIQIPDGKGGIYTKKKSQLTQQEWISMLTSSLDANDRQQMVINGAAMYNFNDEEARLDIENKKLEAIQPNLSRIQNLKSKLPLADEATKLKYTSQIEDLNTLNKQTLARFDEIGKDADSIGGYYMQNAMINNMAAFMAKSSELTYKGTDDAYFKNKKLAQERTGVNVDITERGIIDYNKDNVSDIQSNAIPKEFLDKQKHINPEQVFLDDLKSTENSIEVEVQNIYNSITDKELKESIDEYRQEAFKITGDNKQALTDAIVKYAGSKSLNLDLFKKEKLLGSISKAEASYSAISNASDKSIEVALEPERIFKEIYENDTNIRIHGVDSDITFKNYLSDYSSDQYPNGIKNKEQFSSFMKTDESKKLRASLLIQSSGIYSSSGGSHRYGTHFEYMATTMGREERIRLSEIEKLTGEKFVFNVRNGKQVSLKDVKNGDRVEIAREGGDFISKGLTAIKAGGNAFSSDRIVSEDGDLMSYLGNNKIKQYYDDEFNIQSARIPGSSAITIQGSLGAKQQSALKNELEGITNQKFGDKSNIILIKKNSNEYAIFENQLVTNRTGDTSYKTDFRNPKGTVSVSALKGAQQKLLYNAINFEEAEKNIEFALDRKWKSEPINYKKESIDTEKQLIEYLGTNNELGIYASKESFLNKIKHKHKKEGHAIAKTILDNSNKFQIYFESAKVGENGGIGKLNVQLNNGDVLYSMPVQKQNAADYLKYSQVIPEAFLSLATEYIIESEDNEAWNKIVKAIQ